MEQIDNRSESIDEGGEMSDVTDDEGDDESIDFNQHISVDVQSSPTLPPRSSSQTPEEALEYAGHIINKLYGVGKGMGARQLIQRILLVLFIWSIIFCNIASMGLPYYTRSYDYVASNILAKTTTPPMHREFQFGIFGYKMIYQKVVYDSIKDGALQLEISPAKAQSLAYVKDEVPYFTQYFSTISMALCVALIFQIALFITILFTFDRARMFGFPKYAKAVFFAAFFVVLICIVAEMIVVVSVYNINQVFRQESGNFRIYETPTICNGISQDTIPNLPNVVSPPLNSTTPIYQFECDNLYGVHETRYNVSINQDYITNHKWGPGSAWMVNVYQLVATIVMLFLFIYLLVLYRYVQRLFKPPKPPIPMATIQFNPDTETISVDYIRGGEKKENIDSNSQGNNDNRSDIVYYNINFNRTNNRNESV